MKYELDKRDLVALVDGIPPNYNVMDHPMIKAHGAIVGAPGEAWQWNPSLYDLEDHELWRIHMICKNSWIEK